MEITIKKGDLADLDCGGGFRELKVDITIDKNQSKRQQRQAVIYETLAAELENALSHDSIHNITDDLGYALDQWEGL